MKKYELLSKTISHALRHEPWKYELELDEEGWVDIQELLSVLRALEKKWENLDENDLTEMIRRSSKQRHELKNGKICALYGHSTPNKLLKQLAEPPEILYHGTLPEIASVICEEGLKPMGRHYTHLSIDIETAKQVGYRKSRKPKILVIRAKEAYLSGIPFYIGNKNVWLANDIPSKYVDGFSLKE
jgi:putative RNA 2'-phosphotransferase